MPLVALDESTGEKIISLDFESANEIRAKFKSLTCPFCKERLIPRGRLDYVLHFVHPKSCTSQMEHHPESPEHLFGKRKLYELLKKELQEYTDVHPTLEYPIPEAGERGRIADVAAVFPTGYVLVYECQLASISVAELAQRTEDYVNAGVDVVWFLGKNADTPTNRDWCIRELGVCNSFVASYREVKENFNNTD